MRKYFFFLCLLSYFIWGVSTSFIFLPSSDPSNQPNPNLRFDENHLDMIRASISQYLWPTDASKKITSTFAEYRSKHFHGGIDISTNSKTGNKVFAVQDGYVYKIRITPNGYGKMLFIKHTDGIISTYAHLQTFNEIINEVVHNEQYRVGSYSIDLLLEPEKIKVKKGDIVAYSGDTGFGPPHLHFELRDENLNPINPLLSNNFQIIDDISPTIRGVIIKPLSYGTIINGNTKPIYLSRFPRNGNLYLIPQTLKVNGEIGFCIDARDRANETWIKTGIYKMEFYLDDSLIYSMVLNKIPIEETKLVDLQYDLPNILNGYGHYQKLYIEKGNSLPFFNKLEQGNGIIKSEILKEGEHNYRIFVYDAGNNRTELRGTLIANHEIGFNIVDIDENQVIISGNHLENIEKLIIYGKRAYQPNWSRHTLTKNRFSLAENTITLPVNTKPYDVIKIIAYSKYGSESKPLYKFIKKPNGPERYVNIQTEILENYILFTITTPAVFTEEPKVWISENGSTVPITASIIDLNKYQAVYAPLTNYFDKRKIYVDAEVNGKTVSTYSEFLIYTIQPNKDGEFTLDEGRIKISFDSGAVFKPLYLQIEKENSNQHIKYELKPRDILLNRGITVSVKPADEMDNSVGLYFRSNHGWIFQTSKQDEKTKYLSTLLTYTLGEIGIFKDEIPPAIGRFHMKYTNQNLFFTFRYFDNLSGVDTDEIKIYLDDELIIPEIDGEHSKVFYQNSVYLKKGKHTLRVTLKDRMKNKTEFVRTFNSK